MNLSLRRVSLSLLSALAASLGAQDRIEYTKDLYPGAFDGRPTEWILSRVVDDLTGEPIAGAEVFLVKERLAPTAGEFWHTRKVKTDAGGWLRAPIGDIKGKWHLQVLKHPDYAVSGRGSDMTEIWRVGRAVDLPVQIRDWCDRPVAGASIGWCIGCGHTPDVVNAVTDANGVAILRGVDPHSGIGDVYVQHPGLTLGYDSPRWYPGDPPSRLQCGYGPVATGKVVDHLGKPVVGALVRGGGYHRGPWGVTGNDGTFTILGMQETEGVHHVKTAKGREVWFDAPQRYPVTLHIPDPNSDDPREGPVDAAGEAMPPPKTRVIAVEVRGGPDNFIVECEYPRKQKGDDLEEYDQVRVPVAGPCLIEVSNATRDVYEHRQFSFADAAKLSQPLVLDWQPDVVVRGRAVDERGRLLHVNLRWRTRWSGSGENDEEVECENGTFALPQEDEGLQLLEIVAQRRNLMPRMVWVHVPHRDEQAEVDLGDVVIRSKPQLRVLPADGNVREHTSVAFARAGWQEVDEPRRFSLRKDGSWAGPDLREGDAIVVRVDRSAVPFRTVLEGAGPWQITAPTGTLLFEVANGLAGDVEVTCVIGDHVRRLRDDDPLIGLPNGPLRCYISAPGHQTAIVDTVVTDELRTVRVELPKR